MITKEEALEALDAMDDYARMDVGVNPHGYTNYLMAYVHQESLKDSLVFDVNSVYHGLSRFEKSRTSMENVKDTLESIKRLMEMTHYG